MNTLRYHMTLLAALGTIAVLCSCGAAGVRTDLSRSEGIEEKDKRIEREKTSGLLDDNAPAQNESEGKTTGKNEDTGRDHKDGLSAFGSGETHRPGSKEGASGLKAGFADDNRQFNYFVDFLAKYSARARHLPVNVSERITLRLKDSGGLSVPNAEVQILAGDAVLYSGRSYSDGTFPFFPSEFGGTAQRYRALVRYGGESASVDVARFGRREIDIPLSLQRGAVQRVPLDILFIFDTTGSMGEEIARLKRTIEIIYLNLSALPSRPRVRFGMVLYKDRGDEYVTRIIPLTENLESFQAALNRITASGGGDLPEDLQSALRDAMTSIQWDTQGVRLCFVVTDAPPHLDYGQGYTYVSAVRDARRLGIKVFTVGSGGLDINGEYVLRQISQYTSAKYIFLTYGERGEAEGGVEGSVSHHSGANFQTDKLETIIMRFARDEIYNLSREREKEDEEFFSARRIDTEKSEETLRRLFVMAASQLADYSTIRIREKTPTSVLPFAATGTQLRLNAEYFTEQLIFSMSKSPSFALVERKNLQGILKELELSQSGLMDEEKAARVGKMLGAELIVTGTLFMKARDYEIFLKLLRVETAEVLSVTKAKVGRGLGLSTK
ncbi:MAG: VWA domain-containing protein [Spirochaetes bacterium]|nr:VWA domain-containing protein [Spirochaetota bacterium]